MIKEARYRIGHLLSVVIVMALTGCDDSSEMYCPHEGRTLFESAINPYLKDTRHYKAMRFRSYRVLTTALRPIGG